MAHPPPSQRALFICDVQLGIIDIAFDGDENASAAYIERLNGAICHARSKGDKVIFIRIGYTPTFAEVGPNNRVRSLSTLLLRFDRYRDEKDINLPILTSFSSTGFYRLHL